MTNTTIQIILALISIGGAITAMVMGIINHRKLAIQIAAYFLILTGVIVIMGYMVNEPSVYTPPGTTSMSLPSGICFSVIGGCLLLLVNEIEFKSKTKR